MATRASEPPPAIADVGAVFGPMTQPALPPADDLSVQDVFSALRALLQLIRIVRIVMPWARAWWACRRAARSTGSARR